jgi:hypothetical protein
VISRFHKTHASVTPDSTGLPVSGKRRRVLPVHPLLFAMFPFLAFYAQNFGKTPLEQIVEPLGRALIGTAAVWLVFLALTRQVRKAAFAASVLVLPFFAYGHIVLLLPKVLQEMPWLPASAGLLGTVAILAFIMRIREPLYDTTSGLNVAAVVLLLPSCWTILVGVSAVGYRLPQYIPRGVTLSPGRATVTVDRHLSEAAKDTPDVYYIVLDAYGRADRLQTYYGYDNTAFLQALEARGFFLARRSEPNYNQTPLCLASALSMNYLEAPAGQKLSPEILRQKVDDSAVAAYLRTRGYHYVDVASGLEESRVDTADLVLNDEPDLSIVAGQVLGMTAFGLIPSQQKGRYDRHRRRLNGGFTHVAEVAALPYPKFVFTHILAPHPPFVFGPNGEAINPKGVLNLSDASELLQQITKDEYRRGYIAQLQYVNKRTLEAVDAILRQSKHRPIIIIQGDHGSRMNLDWESLARTDLREPFANLNAYLVPDKVRLDLTDKITPINSFRIILTDVFGAQLPRLPDRNFYSTESHPYDFVDVTERLARLASSSPRARYAIRTGGKALPMTP